MVKTDLFTFEAFPERVVLEGFDDHVLSGLGTFFARISDGGAGDAAYRVVAVGGGGPRLSIEGAAPHPRRPWHRHFRRNGEDVLAMPGGRVRLTPGRAKAVVEWSDAEKKKFTSIAAFSGESEPWMALSRCFRGLGERNYTRWDG